CRAHATGTTNLGLPRDDFLAFRIPALTAGRRATVDALEALDDKIDLNRRMRETLEATARAVFKSWFVDYDPVRAVAEGREPRLPEPISDLFANPIVESAWGPIPTGWGVKELGSDLAVLETGGRPAGG